MKLDRKFIEVRYFETYFYANAIQNILSEPFSYLRNLEEFYGEERWLAFVNPFPKFSSFHLFIEFVIESILYEAVDEFDYEDFQNEYKRYSSLPSNARQYPLKFPFNHALTYYGIKHQSFSEWVIKRNKSLDSINDDDLAEYINELRYDGPIEKLINQSVAEVFYIMFANRGLLMKFNRMIADLISYSQLDEIPHEFKRFFKSDGILKRQNVPSWVRKAVFFRDRGLCALCGRDISGIINIGNAKNFDHIVPLSKGGFNDVTNIQLLCLQCNTNKSDCYSKTSESYESWF